MSLQIKEKMLIFINTYQDCNETKTKKKGEMHVGKVVRQKCNENNENI